MNRPRACPSTRPGAFLAVPVAAALLATSLAAPAQSEEPPGLAPVPEPPEIPARVRSGESLEPDVRIFRRAEERITEYRINGRVRAIKVEPDVGPPYWLIDEDGDGKLDRRGIGPDFVVPQWVLFSW